MTRKHFIMRLEKSDIALLKKLSKEKNMTMTSLIQLKVFGKKSNYKRRGK